MKKIIIIILIIMITLIINSQEKKEDEYLVITGIFGLKYEYASRQDMYNYCLELSKDKNFYCLIVILASSKDFGIQFTYISNEKNAKEKIRNYIDKVYDKFGGKEKCMKVESWGTYPLKDKTDPILILKEFNK